MGLALVGWPSATPGGRRVGPWRLAVLIPATVMALGSFLLGAGPAWAHAELIEVSPRDGAQLASPPADIRLRFTEPVALIEGGIRVLDASGDRVGTADPAVTGRVVRVPFRSTLAHGAYVVSWRVVSSDSHPVGGAFTFAVGNVDPAAAADQAASGAGGDPALSTVLALARWSGFAGLILLVGVPWASGLCWPASARRAPVGSLVRVGAGLVLASAVALVLLQGPYVTGRPLVDAFDPALLGDTLSSRLGLLGLARAALGAVAVAMLAVPAGFAVAAVGLVICYSAWGHAWAHESGLLHVVVDAVHLGAVAFWLGGLVALVATLRGDREGAVAGLPRWSRLAFAAVVVLVLSGALRALAEVGSLEALTGTTYGRLLLLKLALVVVVIGLAAISRSWVRRYQRDRSAADPGPGTAPTTAPRPSRLAYSVGAETGVAAVVLALTAVLVATPPGTDARPASAATAPGTGRTTLPDGTRVVVRAEPPRAGATTVTLTVTRAGRPVHAEEVTATASLPAEGLERLPLTLHETGHGAYTAHGARLPLPGRWRVSVTVRTSALDAYVGTATIRLR